MSSSFSLPIFLRCDDGVAVQAATATEAWQVATRGRDSEQRPSSSGNDDNTLASREGAEQKKTRDARDSARGAGGNNRIPCGGALFVRDPCGADPR